MRNRNILTIFAIIALAASFTFAQGDKDKKKDTKENVLGEVTVNAVSANNDPVYSEFRKLSSGIGAFSGEYATVNNLVLKKDEAVFTFRSGEIYFLEEAQGKRTGAVFFGEGELSIDPPIESEKRSLEYFTKSRVLKEQFTKIVMFFTDKTFEEVKNSPNVQISTNGSQASKARDSFRSKESLLKTPRFRYNMPTRILMDTYAPDRAGFFWGFVDGKKYSNLLFQLDPLGVEEVAPEQVSLTNYSRNSYGLWLGFHLKEEYKKGTGNSNADRRVYDILHHKLDITIRGLRMIATDEMTLQIKTKGQRVLPFNLYRHMRVKRILDENGAEIKFIQESKNKDSALAVILPETYPVGKEFKLIFEYDGVKSLVNRGVGNFVLVSRSNWYPNNIGSRFLDRAAFDIRFRYSKQFMMVGVGELIESTLDENGLKYDHWSTKGVEMATAGFNYGDFKRRDLTDKVTGYELSVYNNKELPGFLSNYVARIRNEEARRANDPRYASSAVSINVGGLNTGSMAKHVLDEALNSVRLFDRYFGKLPHKRIAMTQQPRGGGQAWATLVFMPYTAYLSDTHKNEIFGLRGATREFNDVVGPHEVAHQWWGHAVGWTSYRDQWMSEGFAHLSTSLYIQYVYRDTNRFIKFWENRRRRIVNPSPATNGIKPYTVGAVTQGGRLNSSKAPRAFQALVYPKGAYILHMLRMLMINPKGRGVQKDAKFIAMMTDFIKTHYNQDVSTEDFKRIVEKHITPQMDLYRNGKMDWFFNQWVYGTEIPAYEFRYNLSKSKGKTILNAQITQSGVSKNFVTPVPIYIDFGKGWVELGKATLVGNTTYELKNIPLGAKPRKVAILALKDVLATKVKIKKY